jgi:AraC-like DNA-binding protein
MDPNIRHWWRLIDELPANLRSVERLTSAPPPPLSGHGHLHVTPTTAVCLEGVVRIVALDRTIDLGPGDALIIAAGVWHRHEALRPGSLWLGQGFLPPCSDVMIGDHDRSWWGRLPIQPSRRLIAKVLEIDDPVQRRAQFAELIRQVLAESVEDLNFSHPALRLMLRRMWSNLHRGVTVDALVRASGLSRPHAYRIFTAGFGMPPKEAIATSRLWLAEGLLANGLSVAEVAARSGFPNPDTFARAWKRVHGKSPGRR